MDWLDDWIKKVEASRPPQSALPIAKRTPPPRQPKPEIKHVWFQTRRPVNAADVGEIDLGFYSVADGVLTMCDEAGKPTGKQCQLGPNDDARGVAVRLAKKAWQKGRGEGDFNRRIEYSTNAFV